MARLSVSRLDKAPQLVGQLNSDGTTSLEEDNGYKAPAQMKAQRSLKVALEAAGRKDSDTASNSGSEEDYDALKQEPGTVLLGGRRGGFMEDSSDETRTSETSTTEKSYEAIKPSKTRPMPPRLKSIPITLNKLQDNGRYVLTADDEALKEILKLGIERVCNMS